MLTTQLRYLIADLATEPDEERQAEIVRQCIRIISEIETQLKELECKS